MSKKNYMRKTKTSFAAKLVSSSILILSSTIGVLLQNIFKIKPFCSRCRELDCAFCEMEFNFLIFVAWSAGLILLITYIKSSGFKKLNTLRKITIVIDIVLLGFCSIFPLNFLVRMFLPYY